MKFSIKNSPVICNLIRSFLRIWSHLLKKSLMQNFIFFAKLFSRKNSIIHGWQGPKCTLWYFFLLVSLKAFRSFNRAFVSFLIFTKKLTKKYITNDCSQRDYPFLQKYKFCMLFTVVNYGDNCD